MQHSESKFGMSHFTAGNDMNKIENHYDKELRYVGGLRHLICPLTGISDPRYRYNKTVS